MQFKKYISEILSYKSYPLYVIFVTGIFPVSSVALHVLGWISIRWMIIPNVVMLSLSAYHLFNNNDFRNLILLGWRNGILATLLYDLSRIPFMYLGWDDFIPSLGGWLSNSEENFILGYLWRYFGNGAGLGIGFVVLNYFLSFRRVVIAGILYGLSIFLVLDVVLVCSDYAQDIMFTLTPLSFIGSFTGHLIYGTTLGLSLSNAWK
ncbi:MAG: hypothetical protein HOK65_01720 [Crocinitomicaceae bacterium]|jgi:hypothetical protein|nr:hypothetical protein [Crocinitomicaceae bacterium]